MCNECTPWDVNNCRARAPDSKQSKRITIVKLLAGRLWTAVKTVEKTRFCPQFVLWKWRCDEVDLNENYSLRKGKQDESFTTVLINLCGEPCSVAASSARGQALDCPAFLLSNYQLLEKNSTPWCCLLSLLFRDCRAAPSTHSHHYSWLVMWKIHRVFSNVQNTCPILIFSARTICSNNLGISTYVRNILKIYILWDVTPCSRV